VGLCILQTFWKKKMSDEDNFLDDTVESVFEKLVKEGKFISFDKNGNVV
jgi:hypothetical protein